MSIFTYQNLFKAYLDCRKNKRKTINALKFEYSLEEKLKDLLLELKTGTYSPGRSVRFVVTKPKPREIFAADFRDRIVHHLFVGELLPHAEKRFIHDSYACRKGKGTHKAVERLRKFIKSAGNAKAGLYCAQLDVKTFFPSIDRKALFCIVENLIRKIAKNKEWMSEMLWLARKITFYDAAANYYYKGNPKLVALVPPEKSLVSAGRGKGLPIGNYSSQFFANLYLNELDRFIKLTLKEKYYLRYVDDIIILNADKDRLGDLIVKANDFLKNKLQVRLNFEKTKLESVEKGIDFLGYFLKPGYTLVRRRVVANCREKIRLARARPDFDASSKSFVSMINSYKGHFLHAESRGLREKIFHSISLDAMSNAQKFKYAWLAVFVFAGFFLYANAASADYFKTGSLVSTNLLDGYTDVGAITQFSATTDIPANTTISVQFSRNQMTWYNSSGTLWGSNSLSNGSNAIDISGLGWSGQLFYYKLLFTTTDVAATAEVTDVAVDYTQVAGPTVLNFREGTLESTNFLAGQGNVGAITGFSATTNIPTGAAVTVQFSRNQLTWYNSSGTLWGANSLANGSNTIDISGLGWSGQLFYYKLRFTAPDAASTATVTSVEVTYSSGSASGIFTFKQGTLVSTNLLADGGSLAGNERFGYIISSLPSGTSVKVQFSTDGTNFYDSGGTLWAWDTLSYGSHLTDGSAIELSALGWTGASFYYKLQFDSADSLSTPEVTETQIFSPGEAFTTPAVKVRGGGADGGNVKVRGGGEEGGNVKVRGGPRY